MHEQREPIRTKLIRLTAFLLFAQLCFSALVARRVYADVQDLMLSVGSQMMQLGERIAADAPRTLRLNGAAVRIRVQTAHHARLHEVLDNFEDRCRERNGKFYEQLQEHERGRALGQEKLGVLDGVIRAEKGRAGMVACLDVGDERSTPESMLARARRFVETGDAAAFGDLRYVRAEQDGDDVFVVMLWTDGPFNVKQMFPLDGDAPGIDFAGLPRPPGSRRILSAWEEGKAPALNLYMAESQSGGALESYYRTELPKLGWKPLTPPANKPDDTARGMLVMRDGVTAVVASLTDAKGRGIASIVPTDTQGATAVQGRAP